MSSLYAQYNELTAQEKAYIRLHPHHALTIKMSKATVESETRKRFGFSGHNDQTDAFRHCLWSAILARDLGYNNSLEFTTAHENWKSNPIGEKRMDLHNNSIGLSIGQSGGDNDSLSQKCFEALNSKKLKHLR